MNTPTTEKGCYYNHVNAFAENTLNQLCRPEVRDLAWACFSPPLLHSQLLGSSAPADNCQFPLTPERRLWLKRLDENPAPLLQALAACNSSRLGIYFESLWQFFLASDPHVELLAHNLPVREGGKTLGEFDIIYFCHRRQRHVHLELALKFYLCGPGLDGSEWHHWLGPNSKDRLDLKLAHMLEHQIQLSQLPAATPVLAELGVKQPLRELEIKGRLYHYHQTSAALPPAYNSQLPMHQWAYARDAETLLQPSRHLALAREQWLAPLAHGRLDTSGPQTQPLPNKAQQFAVTDCAQMERHRLFLVANDWPQTHD